jgi:hypothetical protein
MYTCACEHILLTYTYSSSYMHVCASLVKLLSFIERNVGTKIIYIHIYIHTYI